jgi:hypothetical protein
MVLPPQFDSDGHDGHYEEFDPEIWMDQTEADQAYGVMQSYMTGADGFSALQFMDMITDVRNVHYDDKGQVVSYDFDWESEDGDYSGSGHAH